MPTRAPNMGARSPLPLGTWRFGGEHALTWASDSESLWKFASRVARLEVSRSSV